MKKPKLNRRRPMLFNCVAPSRPCRSVASDLPPLSVFIEQAGGRLPGHAFNDVSHCDDGEPQT